jgi:hypothetical protein
VFRQQASIKILADAARSLLQVVIDSGYLRYMQMKRESKAGRERPNELGVLLRDCPANSVINVDDTEMQVPSRGELVQNVQQKNRIGSPGHRNADAVVGREHPVSRDGGEQALVEHGLILRVAGWAVELERNEARWAGTAAGGPPCDNHSHLCNSFIE